MKQVREKQTSYINTYMWNLKKMVRMNLFAVGILHLAYATLISSGSENSISISLWGAVAAPSLMHGVQT